LRPFRKASSIIAYGLTSSVIAALARRIAVSQSDGYQLACCGQILRDS
jgi:hypothetical protein